MTLELEAEGLDEAREALEGMGKSLSSIEMKMVRVAAKGTVKAVKSAIRSASPKLQSRTGELIKAYRYKARKGKHDAVVYPKGLAGSSTIFPKAMTLSYGHSGPTKRASDWNIPARGFVQTGRQYLESGSYMAEVEKTVQRELERYWK